MALDSTSTLAQVQAAFDDNLDYDLDNSATKCKLFIEAARMLLRRQADEIGHGSGNRKDNYKKIEAMLEKAEAWWQANDDTATIDGDSSQYFSFEGLRS